MRVIVLTCESELESANRLGFPTFTYLSDRTNKTKDTIVIRWGNSQCAYDDRGIRNVEFKNVINRMECIRLNCEKANATRLLAQVVNVPTLYEKKVPAGVLAVVRPFEHAAGSDFSVQEGPFNIKPGTYGTKFIKTNAEYRVWFCGNKTMCGRRVKMKINEAQEFPCRSQWGYEFCSKIATDLHYQTLMASKKIGLDTGAADVLYYKNKWYFLELNSAPSVDHRIVREFYQSGLANLIKKKESEHEKEKQIEVVPVVEIRPTIEKKMDNNITQMFKSIQLVW